MHPFDEIGKVHNRSNHFDLDGHFLDVSAKYYGTLRKHFDESKPTAEDIEKKAANMPRSFNDTDVSECFKRTAFALAHDAEIQELFGIEPHGQVIADRLIRILEENIPIKLLINKFEEQDSVSAILSDLVQSSLRSEINRLKDILSTTQKVRSPRHVHLDRRFL